MMIQLHVITKNLEQITDIAELLINKQLITGATVMNSRSIFKREDGKIETVLTNLLIGRTKAILFVHIERLLNQKYVTNMPAIYGVPIISIDAEHMEKLQKVVKEGKA